MLHSITVVIPTYNRPNQLARVLEHILASDVEGFEEVDVIVVDDGSEVPARSIVENLNPTEPFRLRHLYQVNAGPAAARNNGFRAARNEVVLCIDDDILVTPKLLIEHVRGHAEFPGSIIFGRSPFVVPEKSTPAYEFLTSLEAPKESATNFERIYTVASGNISFERSIFPEGSIYDDGLKTPAAEEFELEHRLNVKDIPIYLAHNAVGWHLQPPLIQDKCKQEYKYGVGAAEVFVKVPEIIGNSHVRAFIESNGHLAFRTQAFPMTAKKIVKSALAQKQVRSFLLGFTLIAEKVLPFNSVLFRFYRLLCGVYLFAGVRNGLKTFQIKI